jgi:hypothetical protein
VIGCTRPQSLRSKVDLRWPEKRTEKYPEKYRYVGDGLPICHRQSVSRSHQTLPRSDNRLVQLARGEPPKEGREKQRGKNFSRLVQLTIFRTGAECWLLVQRSPIVNDHDDEVRAAFTRIDEGRQRIILVQEQSRRAAYKTVAVTVVIYAF